MSLKANAIITRDEFISSLGLNKNDLQLAAFTIYNSSADATAATIAKSGSTLTLVVTGGANAGTTAITLTNVLYDTIAELAAYINALGKGWVVNTLCADAFASTDLLNIGATSCLLVANELTVNAFNGLLIDECINTASQFAETFCRRKFVSASYTEYLNGDGTNRLFLPVFPVTVLTSLELFDYNTDSVIYTFVEHEEYEVYLSSGYIYIPGRFSRGVKNYKVVYTAGYTAATMPEDIKNAVKELAKFTYLMRDKQGIKSESIGKYSVSYDKSSDQFVNGFPIPANIIGMLIPYKSKDLR